MLGLLIKIQDSVHPMIGSYIPNNNLYLIPIFPGVLSALLLSSLTKLRAHAGPLLTSTLLSPSFYQSSFLTHFSHHFEGDQENLLRISSKVNSSQTLSSRGFLPRRETKLSNSDSSSSSQPEGNILRKRIPPPLPATTYLVNEHTMYHVKLQRQGGLEYGTTHEDCMQVEYERYGCDDCIWIKCHGETHGYPDINP